MGSGWRGMVAGSDFPLAAPVHALITVGNVEEKVLFVMLLSHRVRRRDVSMTAKVVQGAHMHLRRERVTEVEKDSCLVQQSHGC